MPRLPGKAGKKQRTSERTDRCLRDEVAAHGRRMLGDAIPMFVMGAASGRAIRRQARRLTALWDEIAQRGDAGASVHSAALKKWLVRRRGSADELQRLLAEAFDLGGPQENLRRYQQCLHAAASNLCDHHGRPRADSRAAIETGLGSLVAAAHALFLRQAPDAEDRQDLALVATGYRLARRRCLDPSMAEWIYRSAMRIAAKRGAVGALDASPLVWDTTPSTPCH